MIEEAVEIYRQLSQEEPTYLESELSSSLLNLANCLTEQGRTQEGLNAAEEAAVILRRLTEQAPKRFEPNLARTLNAIACALARMGRNIDAQDALKEAMTIFRRLSQRDPERFEQSLLVAQTMLQQLETRSNSGTSTAS